MVRSRLAVAGLILLVIAVLAVKAARAPRPQAAARETRVAQTPAHHASSAQAPRPEAAKPAPPTARAAAEGGQATRDPKPGTGADLAKCLQSGKPTLADFGEGWCEQCQKMVPVLAAAAKRYRGKANVVFVDTKAYPQYAQAYKVVRIPTQIFFDGKGYEVNRHIGYYPIEDIAKEMGRVGVHQQPK